MFVCDCGMLTHGLCLGKLASVKKREERARGDREGERAGETIITLVRGGDGSSCLGHRTLLLPTLILFLFSYLSVHSARKDRSNRSFSPARTLANSGAKGKRSVQTGTRPGI